MRRAGVCDAWSPWGGWWLGSCLGSVGGGSVVHWNEGDVAARYLLHGGGVRTSGRREGRESGGGTGAMREAIRGGSVPAETPKMCSPLLGEIEID